jgi:hypothetical protein
MPAIFKTINTDLSKVDRLLYLVNSTYFFGIGKNTTWDTSWGDDVSEENPPMPESNVINLPEVKLYKQPIYQTLAVESQCGTVEFDSCGSSKGSKKFTLINLETTSRETLNLISPNYLYFKIEITENDLTFASINSFRVAGLYKDITFTSLGQIRYLPTLVLNQGTLYWASYFTPLEKNNNINTTYVQEIIIKA